MAGLQGRTLGGYQLSEQIASAGIAEVYRAHPLAANGREVVIKVIYPEFARYPGFLPNFQQIVQTAARLASHPHILPVVASGEENGYLYLATPWVADGSLRDLIARGGRLGAGDVGPFFQQLCGALAYAHSLSLVHGNLKPSNVLLYEGRHVMLGDFGMLWDIRQLDMNHSGSGTDVVEYLAPESFGGQFTQQSDIYSLGAMLFATLTGRAPFSAARPADLRDAHMQYPPPRLAQIDPSLPPAVQALDPVIQQAMAKRPEDRFPSAMALSQAIDAILKQQPAISPAQVIPALPAAPRAAQSSQQPIQPLAQPGLPQPGVPGAWAAPGPIQSLAQAVPGAPVAGLGALAAPGGAMRPLDPPFPPLPGGQSAGMAPVQPAAPLMQGWPALPEPPMAQGWPAAPASADAAEGIQYTERVPAPQAARPLLAQPQPNAQQGALLPPSAPSIAEPDPWDAQYLPAVGDDPDWRQNVWPAETGSSDGYDADGDGINGYDDYSQQAAAPRRQAARDDDWRLARNAPSQAAPGRRDASNYPSDYASEYTDQRLALPDESYSMSRADWGGAQSGPHSEALRYRGGFSATELGLPRLTNPALQGELPPEWEDLLAGEMLPSRADVGSGGAHRPASRQNPPSSYAYSNASQPYAPERMTSRPASQWGQAANDGRSYWQPAVASPGPGSQRAQPMPTLASAHHPAMGASRAAPPPAAPPQRQRRKRRWPAVLLALALVLTLVGGGFGVVLAKPAACPGAICTQANHFLHSRLSFLGPPSNANVLAVAPNTLTVHAISGSSTNLNVQVSNSGTDSAIWHATASVGWLTITPGSGTLLPGSATTLSIVARPLNVNPGNYAAQVMIATNDTSIRIPVAAAIAIGPKISLADTTLNFTQCGVAQTFKVNNTGDHSLTYSATPSDANVMQLGSVSGSINPGASLDVPVTINCSALFADYSISVTSNGGNGTITIHYT